MDTGSKNDPKALVPVWTTTPHELIRASSKPIVLSTTPDVAKTPMGSATPPIPYNTWADPVNESNYARTVFATQQKVMTLNSVITVTHGAEQGTATGVKSGTINDITEPQQHSSAVRVEGHYVIRHLDRAFMNKGNNIGEFIYIEDTSVHAVKDNSPEEEQGFWDSLWEGAKDLTGSAVQAVQEFSEEHRLLQRGVGALQTVGGGVEAVVGGAIIAGSGVGTVLSGGSATPVMVITATGGAALGAKGVDDFTTGLRTLWTGEVHDSYLDKGVSAVGGAFGASDETIMVMQGAAGAIGNPANIVKEGGERIVRESVEAGTERVGREAAEEVTEAGAEKSTREGAKEANEETAEKNTRISGTNNGPPSKANDVLEHVRKTGRAPEGYKGGKKFQNDGRGGGEFLPTKDNSGSPISYKEYDVNPFQKGVNRGGERIVVGSNGKAYYTSNHYETFTLME